MLRVLCACAFCAALILGCKDKDTPFKPGETITVQGQLQAGVECPVVVAKDGKRYSVGGDLGGFGPGDRVCVTGTIAEVSYCMAGDATLHVRAIGPENDCP